MPTMSDRLAGLSPMVRLYLGLVVIIAVGMIIAPFAITPTYQNLYKDFAKPDNIPTITNLVCQTWFPIALSLLTLGLAAAGFFMNASPDKRRTLVMTSVVAAMASAGIYLYGLYAPIYQLADKIK